MFTVEHLLFNTAVVVLFFKENEWKWSGLCMLLSNFIDLDNFYSFDLDNGDASALDIHYLHGQAQLNLILFFSCTLVLIAHRLKPSAESPILAFTIGLVFHVVGDWWSWVWGYSVTVALIGIGSFVLITLLRARYSPYRFYIFLFIGHVCTIFTLGFIVFLILIGDDMVDTTEHIWPTIVDNCGRLIMVLPWYFLMRVAEVDHQAASTSKPSSRRRDPAVMRESRASESESSESESSEDSSNQEPEGNETRKLNTLLPVSAIAPAQIEDDFIKKITPDFPVAAKSPQVEMIKRPTKKPAEKAVSVKKDLKMKHQKAEFEQMKKVSSLPRQSVKDPTRINPNLLTSPKHRGSGSIFSLGMFAKGECYE